MRLLAAALAVALPLSAHATCPSLDDEAISTRLLELDVALEDGETWSKWWWYGWIAGYGGLAAGQLTLGLLSDDRRNAHTNYVGMTGSLLGLAVLLIRPMTSAYAHDWFTEDPEDTAEARLAKLRRGEDLLQTAAKRQAGARGLVAHAGVAVWTLGASAFTLWAIEDEIGALKVLIGSGLIGEARVLTAPWTSIDAWEAYAGRHADAGCAVARATSPTPSLAIAPSPGGLGLALTW